MAGGSEALEVIHNWEGALLLSRHNPAYPDGPSG